MSANDILNLVYIDEKVGKLNTNFEMTSPYSFILSVLYDESDTIVGAKFTSNSSGENIFQSNSSDSLNGNFTVAALVDNNSLQNIKYLNLFLISKPTDNRFVNDSKNQTLVSSIVIVNPQVKNNNSIKLKLYFTNEDLELANASPSEFRCAYFDSKTSSWNPNECQKPVYNDKWKRYECNCSHLSSFGLIWLPERGSDQFEAIDYVSLVFQSLSILCFIIVITHSIVTRMINPVMKLESVYLLPLISSSVTVLLFIFYIALSLTVYTKTRSMKIDTCFTSATVLMFFVYFFIIFMFGTKTSIGYFNFILFVRLFPPPLIKNLVRLIILSFTIAIISVIIGIILNARLSSGILTVHANQICWFRRNVIHYFMTIPTGIFLLINLCLFLLVTKRMIDHTRNATSPHQTYHRMKQCVILLIASSVSQGIGWITGPFLLINDPGVGRGFEWIFVICNALEGVWTILIYIVIRRQRLYEAKRVTIVRDRTKMKSRSIKEEKEKNIDRHDIDYPTDISRLLQWKRYGSDRFAYRIRLDSLTGEFDA